MKSDTFFTIGFVSIIVAGFNIYNAITNFINHAIGKGIAESIFVLALFVVAFFMFLLGREQKKVGK